jgi:nickel-dependent lactate racemase
MQIGIDYSLGHLDLEVRESNLVGVQRHPPAPALADPAAAVRAALEEPVGFPALRRALTPDDHVVIVLDEQTPRLPELLMPLLEHIAAAHVRPEALTLVCPPLASPQQYWLDGLPDAFQEVQVEVHDPTDRRHLSYLATTRRGRRLYLNRTVVDADQLVVFGRRGYDPLLGYAGAEGALYPALSDEATRQELWSHLSLAVPGKKHWPVRQEAAEVAWLLGAPFFVQIIEGAGEEVAHVVTGLVDTSGEGDRLLDARWRVTVEQPADTVIASVSGDPSRHSFADLARALACASHVVKPEGRIVLLSETEPELGPAVEILRHAENPNQALQLLRKHMPPDMAAAFQWAGAAQRAAIYLLSGIPAETAEEMFTVPLEHAGQVQRLLGGNGSCLFLADAHKTMAVARKPPAE